jgi:hypothetical protein
MGTLRRLTASVTAAGITILVFAPSAGAASPSPSPSLGTVLVAPGGQYAEIPSGQGDGPIATAADYAGTDTQTLSELQRDGFVQGYVRTWIDQGQKHLVVEEVIAFGGHRDAGKWLKSIKDASSSQHLVHPLTADGVDSYFGGHYADPTQPVYSDLGIFLKGNDFFFVGAQSATDDLGNIATLQAKRQFDAAPAYSISPNQWPENTVHLPFSVSGTTLPLVIGGGAVLLLAVLAVIAVMVVLLTRRRAPALATAAPIAAGPQMSVDGRYWWDGQAWRDTSREAPPDALRSADGYYWWDSRTWRPVPPAS